MDWERFDTSALADELISWHRRMASKEAEWLRGLALFDDRRGWELFGHRSAAAWLAAAAGLSEVTARDKLRVARVLADGLPHVAKAFRAGRISYTAARILTRLPEADEDTERALLAAAEAGLPVRLLETLVRRARDTIDPDAADADALSQFQPRSLHLTRGLGGTVLGSFELDPEDGDLLFAAIDSVLAGERAAGNPIRLDDSRESPAPAQRRADALMALVRAGLSNLEADHPGRARTELLVLVDYDTLVHRAGGVAQTGSGAPLTAEQVRRLCCDAGLRRVVLQGGSELLDVGVRSRSFTPAQRAAMFARDRGCRWPGCRRWFGLHPHHVIHWADGGATASSNGAWHCTPHHRLLHEGAWTITGDADHALLYHPPDGRPALESRPPGEATQAA